MILLEHDPKSTQGTQKGWGRGAGAKRAALSGVSYLLEADRPLTHVHDGWWRLVLSKDRPGGTGRAEGHDVAKVHVVVAEDESGRVERIRLLAPDERPAEETEASSPTETVILKLLYEAPSRRILGKGNLRGMLQERGERIGNDKLDAALNRLEQVGRVKAIREPGRRPIVYEWVSSEDAVPLEAGPEQEGL